MKMKMKGKGMTDSKHITYKEGDWKYQLLEDYKITLGSRLRPHTAIDLPFIKLTVQGVLTILKGYCWDGPSGPMLDTKNAMRGALVHDALYQLMRMEQLPREYKQPADELFRDICREDGMSWFRAWYALRGLEIGGDPATDPKNKKVALTAP